MTLLYRLHDEILMEASPEMWVEVEKAVNNWLSVGDARLDRELTGFANAIRAHLQHVTPETAKHKNLDLA